MIQLQANTSAQSIYMTLYEYRRHIPTFTDYLMVIKSATSDKEFIVILDVTSDNERYTVATLGTDTDDAVNSAIQITEPGQYRYTVYGQNSSTNLDPDDASVVGTLEKGVIWVVGSDEYYSTDNPNLPDFIIHRES